MRQKYFQKHEELKEVRKQLETAETNAGNVKDLQDKLKIIEEEREKFATLFFEQDNLRKELEEQLAEERASNTLRLMEFENTNLKRRQNLQH